MNDTNNLVEARTDAVGEALNHLLVMASVHNDKGLTAAAVVLRKLVHAHDDLAAELAKLRADKSELEVIASLAIAEYNASRQYDYGTGDRNAAWNAFCKAGHALNTAIAARLEKTK